MTGPTAALVFLKQRAKNAWVMKKSNWACAIKTSQFEDVPRVEYCLCAALFSLAFSQLH